jgi:hypothetical protein
MNLREADYDFQKVWHSEAFRESRRKIAEERCSCTHCVFLDYSIVHNRRALLFGLPRQYLKFRKKTEGDEPE